MNVNESQALRCVIQYELLRQNSTCSCIKKLGMQGGSFESKYNSDHTNRYIQEMLRLCGMLVWLKNSPCHVKLHVM